MLWGMGFFLLSDRKSWYSWIKFRRPEALNPIYHSRVAASFHMRSWQQGLWGAPVLIHALSCAEKGKECHAFIQEHVTHMTTENPQLHTRVINVETSLWAQWGYMVAAAPPTFFCELYEKGSCSVLNLPIMLVSDSPAGAWPCWC